MLVCGDIHGNLEKLNKFLKYKFEEKHLLVGDYVDDFPPRRDEEIIECLERAVESDAILLWGNHEVHYLKNPPFLCSGYRKSYSEKIQEILYKNLDRFNLSHLVDNYLITHAGVNKDFPFKGNSKEFYEHFNFEMKKYLVSDLLIEKDIEKKPIFYCGRKRVKKGKKYNEFSGPLWFDHRYEKLNDSFIQIFGHTPITGENIHKRVFIDKHICVDLPEYYLCFNIKTKKFEDFG